MRTSFFALATSLLFAAFVSASPIEGSLAIEKRCNDGSCCASHEFWYKPKSCCLTSGGPPKTNTPNPPSGKGCPNNWYWHTGHKCCTPRNPPSNPSNPNPTCNSSTFPRWDFGDHCCKSNPPSGSNPPGPNPSHRPQREARQPKSKYAKHARKLTEREAKCPADTEYCPGQGCFESFNNLESCGGCPGAGGQDCEAIPNVLSVGCEASGVTSSCVVFSCDDGFKPSADRKSCEAE